MIEFLLIVGGILIFVTLNDRITRLQREVAGLRDALARSDRPEVPARREATPTPPVPAPDMPQPAPAARTATTRTPARNRALPRLPEFSFESLVGGQLPIWVGGAALVLAGFFLVRLTIESGLLGPVARTSLAALFALTLVVASEFTHRFAWTRDDPRVAQAFAGAGVASGYGTLYIAAALYDLVAPLPAFVTMLVITGGALALALRHGPPTAVMALAGGFAAPLVAGYDAAGIGPLLVYLALFIAALFGLAMHRGWGWLALAAAAAGFGWVNFLLYALAPQHLAGLGAFVVLLAAAAGAAFPATGLTDVRLRLAPLLAGFVQLMFLAPVLNFDGLAWGFYLILAAATLFLAWRDTRYLPGAIVALALMLMLEALGLGPPDRTATAIAALVATALFALPAHLLLGRAPGWTILAVAGTGGPLLIAQIFAPALLPVGAWIALALTAAALTLWVGWRVRDTAGNAAITGATCLAGLLAAIGLGQAVPFEWLNLPVALIMLGLGGWARLLDRQTLFLLPAIAFAGALLVALPVLWPLLEAAARSLAGAKLPYPLLPGAGDTARMLLAPALAAAWLLRDARQFGRARAAAAFAALFAGLLTLYVVAKQPLALADESDFRSWGFFERAAITQVLLAGGWALSRGSRWSAIGKTLLAIGCFRLVWFDWLMLNPALLPQSVGSLPLLNLLVIHLALAAFWLWWPVRRALRPAAAIATIAALLGAVRQASHGAILTGPVTTAENGGYSAVLLLLALFWLWRGIRGETRDLRVFGLGLLTIVTFKVFLIDAAALDGVLRILSFLGLGLGLIAIGWAYGRFLGGQRQRSAAPES
ncbi:DUF2339 domain-containing protein [Stakelama tenebrarum]|uniref:DUF2339 domain-containing protein n=1 Tax=Stakelama tenebrarum TaxID=2711215 RepID=A0A6G6Y9J9_9SPHN|nr:DUF2339 domain-containing protein [Sphingosinithalassobacter tenebrarum]QIG81580.1 DUF2339 domain-containing protein [Sphingosinithalassobacter tenebrarum]